MFFTTFMNNFANTSSAIDFALLSDKHIEKSDNTTVVPKENKIPAFIIKSYRERENEKKEAIRKATVCHVMDTDKYMSSKVDKDEMYGYIDKASKMMGVDPVVIAAIIRKESHFSTPKSIEKGSGLMQVTSIVVEDMYQRPEVYPKSLEPILKKYKNPKKLMEAVRKNPELNVIIGTAVYKQRLDYAKGDVHKALVYYNTTKYANSYADTICGWVNDAKAYGGSLDVES